MKRYVAPLLLTAGLLASSPALAKNSQKFENTIAASVDSIAIEVVLSEDMAWRANNLPKDRRDRGNIRSSRDGFGGNGYYGERDLNNLVDRIERKMTDRFEKEGIAVDDNATHVLTVVLDDARPTRPTFEQMSKNPGLSQQSFALGGASFNATLSSASGEAEGEISYGWYEKTLWDYSNVGSTWSDSHRAIDRFARKTAKSMASE